MNQILCGLLFLLTPLIGQMLLAQDTPPPEGLYRVNADGTDIQSLLVQSDTFYWGPDWSHDGTRFVMTVGNVGESGGELYISNSDGSDLTALTHNGRNNYFPVWSPNDQSIAFVSQEGATLNTAEIYVIAADGSDEIRLTNNTTWEYGISWLPEGEGIAFGSEQSGTWGIYIMNVDGGTIVPLAEPAKGNSPTWSPDGQQIVFTSNQDGDDDIYIANSDGSNQRNLTHNTDWDDNPRWSPDGSRIAFASNRDGYSRIYTFALDTGELLTLTPSLELAAGFPVWSPDSRQLLFHARALTAEEQDNNVLPMLLAAVALIGGLLVIGLVRSRKKS